MADTLTITDNRTGRQYEVPITDGTIRAIDLRQIKVEADEFGLLSYDPAFLNTANCRSSITFIDGDKGILRYRGYPIEQLAEQSSFVETAWLLLNGELPAKEELAGLDGGDRPARGIPRERQEARRGLPPRRAPDGRVPERGRGPVDLLPRREAGARRRSRAGRRLPD